MVCFNLVNKLLRQYDTKGQNRSVQSIAVARLWSAGASWPELMHYIFQWCVWTQTWITGHGLMVTQPRHILCSYTTLVSSFMSARYLFPFIHEERLPYSYCTNCNIKHPFAFFMCILFSSSSVLWAVYDFVLSLAPWPVITIFCKKFYLFWGSVKVFLIPLFLSYWLTLLSSLRMSGRIPPSFIAKEQTVILLFSLRMSGSVPPPSLQCARCPVLGLGSLETKLWSSF